MKPKIYKLCIIRKPGDPDLYAQTYRQANHPVYLGDPMHCITSQVYKLTGSSLDRLLDMTYTPSKFETHILIDHGRMLDGVTDLANLRQAIFIHKLYN